MHPISRRNMHKFLLAGCTSLAIGEQSESRSTPARLTPETNSNLPSWSDVIVVEQPEPIISYRTGWVVYEESLTKGALV
ncbi:MAG: hypothetical protein JO028_00915, partial [Acidobacteriaceae bacterium]|nr:hypothetical protein [Acidobacteriaceae bacterium]